MLEEMDKELEQTDSRLKALTSRVQTAIRKSGGKENNVQTYLWLIKLEVMS